MMTDWTKHLLSMTSLMMYTLEKKMKVEHKTDSKSKYANELYNKMISDIQLVIDDLDKARLADHECKQQSSGTASSK